MKTSDEIDKRLNTILEGYKQRSTLRDSLQTYDKGDYGKDSEKGRLLTSILTQMEAVELKILANIVKLPMLFEPLCKKQGVAANGLDVIRFFRPYQAIERILSNCEVPPQSFFKLGCKTYNMLIQPADKQNADSEKPSGLVDVRHLIQLDGDVYDVVVMIESLVRIWSLVLESNLDCAEHAFVHESKSIEAIVWVNGGFYDAATKQFSPTDTNKQSQIVSPELTVVKQDLQKRLKQIEFCFRKRYERRDATQNLCGHDAQARTKEYQDFVMELQLTEDNLLHELYHFGDNIKKYLKICNRIEDKKVVDNFLPYRWCGNYVNHLKHGSKRKKRLAIPGYQIQFFDQTGLKPTIEDKLVDCAFLINVDGRLEAGMEIAQRLIDMWLLFLRYHSDIDITETIAWINSVRRKEFLGKATYTAKIPDGVLDDAKRQAQERRRLNL